RIVGLPIPTQASAAFLRGSAVNGRPCCLSGMQRALSRCSNHGRWRPWADYRWQSGECRVRACWGRSRSMGLGICHEFPVLPGRSQAECFAAGFDIVDASEEYGLDVMWLAELHFDKRRARTYETWSEDQGSIRTNKSGWAFGPRSNHSLIPLLRDQ